MEVAIDEHFSCEWQWLKDPKDPKDPADSLMQINSEKKSAGLEEIRESFSTSDLTVT